MSPYTALHHRGHPPPALISRRTADVLRFRHIDDAGFVGRSVHDRPGQDRVVERLAPLVEGEVGGNCHR